MSATAAELRAPVRVTIRRRWLVALGLLVPVALVAAYVATNVAASLAQRDLRERWAAAVAAGPVEPATLALRTFAPGEPVARLVVPAASIDVIVVEGGGGRGAPAHVPSTVLPGLHGTSTIAGGRFGWGNHFLHLERLVPGDVIVVQTLAGEQRFVVRAVGVESRVPVDSSSPEVVLLLVSPSRAWGGDGKLVVRAEPASGENR